MLLPCETDAVLGLQQSQQDSEIALQFGVNVNI